MKESRGRMRRGSRPGRHFSASRNTLRYDWFRMLRVAALLMLCAPVPLVSGAEASNSMPLLFHGEAVTELAPHGKGNVYAPSVIVEGDRLRMWYGGQGKDGH